MGASYGKLTPAHREAIYDLRKRKATGRVIREKLLAGHEGLDPVELSVSECLRVAKRLMDERDELFSSKVQSKPPNEGLVLLTKRLIIVAERETVRQELAVKAGRLDANKLGRLASALIKLYGLVERSESPGGVEPAPGGEADNSEPPPSTFADDLAGAADADSVPDGPPAPPVGTPPALADQVLTGSGAPRGRPPTPAQSVPPGLPLPAPQGGVATSDGPSASASPGSDATD